MDILLTLTDEFKVKPFQIENTVKLIDEGNTIPFIARYRKEAHGSLDDQILREIADRLEYLRNLEKRREEVRASIEEQEKMTEEISAALDAAVTLAEIEDIYRPFRQKRKTRASVAKEKGLEPLALAIFEQNHDSKYPLEMAVEFIDTEKGVETAEDAVNGAKDIIAEMLSDDASIRKRLRVIASAHGKLNSKGTKEEDSVYSLYYEFSEPLSKVAGHKILAIDRGEREELLKVSVDLDKARGLNVIYMTTVKQGSPCTQTVTEACDDSYDRLIFPSIEREIRNGLTEQAAEAAIKVFSTNLRHLLMQPPVKGHVTLGLDPGYRTGCKTAVVDGTGRVLDTGVIYPVPPHNKVEEAKAKVKGFIKKYNVTVIAIGNGTASKETEMFASEVISELDDNISYMVVSEAGASVYSASKLAAQEFPEYDVSLRSAVSIARRLQDPLAELVKIDPKAIGVGQYQHDMPKKRLDTALDGVVEDCVNAVGVDLNTASASLLSRIAGVNATVSKLIVEYREENGSFTSRAQLKKVPKLGPKAFEQCAGFLRVAESKNILDNTGVHPESYDAAKSLIKLLGFSDKDIKNGNLTALPGKIKEFGEEKAAEELSIGLPTLEDIVKELLRPGRDPRDELPKPILRKDVLDIKDLKAGMEFDGTVRNVIDFGAFVDIGVHQDGLVHISEIVNRYIKHPSEVLKVGDIVKVRILSVDIAKNRISMTMKLS